MSREVCGICWCPYDEETGACGCEPASKEHDMTTLRTAAQQALEALEAMTQHFGFARLGSSSLADTMKRGDAHVAMNNLRAALAEPDGPCPTCVALARTVMMDQMGRA